MKKNLLIGLFVLATVMVNAQVVLLVEAPEEAAGNYAVTVAEPGGWGVPDMNDPANGVFGEMVMAVDATEADSLLCEAVANVDDVNGKIAVLYRGACEFGTKALNAQNAGAIAVVIINHSGDPIAMGGGADGPSVTIPVAMISTADGAFLRPFIEAGGANIGIFNKTGFFNVDLGVTPVTVVRAEHFAHPTVLSQNGDYVVQLGAGLINYGIDTQSNVSLSAVITKDESVLYNETSATVLAMATGDTVDFDLPSFTMDQFEAGLYKVTYAIVFSNVDEFPADNIIEANFMISDSLFSYSRIDNEGLPANTSGSRPTGTNESVHQCIAFQNPNASSVQVDGLTFSSSLGAGEDMVGITVDVYLYEWTAEFDNLDDPNLDLSVETLDELTFGSFEYTDNAQADENIYVPFEDGAYVLSDDTRYLFCINHFTDGLFTSFDNGEDYTKNQEVYNQPLFPNESNEEWFPLGFGPETVPAISVNMKDPNFDAVNEQAARVEITPFPNPTANEVNIPVGNNYGETVINVYDIAGKNVKTINVTTTSFEVLKVDVSDLDNGAYIFKMNFEDGSFSNFNVVVNN